MRIIRLSIKHFRGIESAMLTFPEHVVLVGDNNTGKSTVLEAIDLVLGPDRSSRVGAIDEHDFYAGHYLDAQNNPVPIEIEATIIGLNEEQRRHFREHLEWWDESTQSLLDGPPASNTDSLTVQAALRVCFRGQYDAEEDDFVTATFFASPIPDNDERDAFKTFDKRLCGFLFLRTLRTGSRALSLERGSLLDTILRLQEKRLQMWEDILAQLRVLPVAENAELGISSVLSSVQKSLREFVYSDWPVDPHMRVSDSTREGLRKILTVFMSTGAKRPDGSHHAAPFQHQGTGTINTIVLALLSQIAELKQNVIFAMEEPEIAIPPHTQKRIVDCVKQRSAQVFFTSHSPYVLEEFKPSSILVLQNNAGTVTAVPTTLPPTVKPKAYRAEMRTRFCEAILAKHVLIAEGRTEYDAIPAAARRLHELSPNDHQTFEALGIAVVDAQTDSQVEPLGAYFAGLGKVVFSICDEQAPAAKIAIQKTIAHSFFAPTRGFEDLIVTQCAEPALKRYAAELVSSGEWPRHLNTVTPKATSTLVELRGALREYLRWGKGAGGAAYLIGMCSKDEMPAFIVDTLAAIQKIVAPLIECEVAPSL